jgi:hypothetical protein
MDARLALFLTAAAEKAAVPPHFAVGRPFSPGFQASGFPPSRAPLMSHALRLRRAFARSNIAVTSDDGVRHARNDAADATILLPADFASAEKSRAPG